MRHLLLALMIVLLPLRGWVGDAMAADMAAASTSPQQVVAVAAPAEMSGAPTDSAAHDDCPGHASASPEAPAPVSHADCSTCPSCQACHAVGMVAGVPALPALPLPMAPPVTRHAVFTSAVPAPGLKPPIS
jgi:hypothetical protein